jgi:hypothetical protein
VQVRGIMSVASSSAAFDLRCEVRETMMVWLQESSPGALPKVRTSLVGPADRPGAESRHLQAH